MKKIKKRVILIAILTLTFLCKADVGASYDHQNPESIHTYGDFKYAYDTETGYIWITDYIGSEETVVFPAEINEVPVKYVIGYGRLEGENKNVKKVIIPEGVEKIWGFGSYTNLEEIVLPETLKIINDETFYWCKKLKKINLPSSLEKIGKRCFFNCISLKSIRIPEKVKKIEAGTFVDCENLKQITLSNGLKTIGEEAFAGCLKLKEIYIPDSVTRIEASAFFDCEGLKKVRLSKNLTEIKKFSFACTALKSITIPKKVKKI